MDLEGEIDKIRLKLTESKVELTSSRISFLSVAALCSEKSPPAERSGQTLIRGCLDET